MSLIKVMPVLAFIKQLKQKSLEEHKYGTLTFDVHKMSAFSIVECRTVYSNNNVDIISPGQS